jgi:signal transduction histidine kinase/sensor domain CHASE-containing protein
VNSSLSSLVRQHRWAAGVLLGLLGLLLNAFPVRLSPGIDALFGGVAYLLAAVALGPGPGFLAAAIASVRTVWLWGHPWAWLIFSLEALVVGYLVLRWSRRPLTATALYWLLLGVPLLYLTYWGIMGVEGTTLTIIALKQPLNALVNAVAVEALLLLPGVRRTLRIPGAPRLRTSIAVLVLVAAIVPALVFGVWAGRREWIRSMELAEDRVEFAALAYASKLEQYVLLHQQSIRSLAQSIEGRPEIEPQRLQQLLQAEREQFPGFLNVYVADARGVTIGFYPAENSEGESLIGLDFSDRPYFERVRRTRQTVISEVFQGRGGADKPLVIIAHPIVRADTFAGFVLGAVDLEALPRPVAAAAQAERLRVGDSEGHLIHDTWQPYQPGDRVGSVPREYLDAALEGEGGSGITVYQRESATAAAAVVAARVLVGYASLPALGWWVWVEHPFARIEGSVAQPYTRLLTLLVILMILAGIFSTLLSGWLAAPLLRLRWVAAALASGDRRARVREMPAGVPLEISELGQGFDEMADSLAEHAEELEELSEIARSLASTLDSTELLRQITDSTMRLVEPDGCGITLLDPERDVLEASEYSLGLLAPTAGREIPVEGSLVGWVTRHESSARVTHVDADTRLYRTGVDLREIGSVICAPLIGRSGPLGALTAVRSRSHPHPFSSEHLKLIERLARSAAIAVENARLIEAAQEASRVKSDFIAAMSHELRTPLNAVLGHLQLLELQIHGPTTEKQQEALERIGAATRHLRSLIEEVLSFARLEAGRAEVHVVEVDLCELAQEVAAVIEPLAWEKKLDFKLDRCDAAALLHTDADKVRQILINLAGNAVKFTEEGGIRLAVETLDGSGDGADGQPGASGGEMVVRVIDTGPGISQRDRQRLFRPFEQLESGLSRSHGGTGLGLYLSGQYATLLGGRIEVESQPGKGSVFSLILPRTPPVETTSHSEGTEGANKQHLRGAER